MAWHCRVVFQGARTMRCMDPTWLCLHESGTALRLERAVTPTALALTLSHHPQRTRMSQRGECAKWMINDRSGLLLQGLHGSTWDVISMEAPRPFAAYSAPLCPTHHMLHAHMLFPEKNTVRISVSVVCHSWYGRQKRDVF